MRKILIAALAAATLVPAMASAQSRGEVRRDQQEVRRHTQNGDYRAANRARQEAREDRQELREDWRDYRNSHRQVYQRGAYAAPRGYNYRPINAGYRFAPAQYNNRYWLNDYRTYRLPNPGYNQRWMRYGNDVVLIDTRRGVALRVLSAFFL